MSTSTTPGTAATQPLPDQVRRAAMHAALGEPLRLAIVEDLAHSDRSPGELAARFGLATNLLAHHLDVLHTAGLIERFTSSGDKRRRYVRLVFAAAADVLGVTHRVVGEPTGRVLFVCSANSARSQLAAALWRARTGGEADSAGTEPAEAVHPGAVAAARRADLDLSAAVPRELRSGDDTDAAVVITVCDRAHEELAPGSHWWHWSTPDPVAASQSAVSRPFADGADPFDLALAQLDARIAGIARSAAS